MTLPITVPTAPLQGTDSDTLTSSSEAPGGHPMSTLQGELQRLSGTTLDAQGAANAWAGTTGRSLVGALNVKAGTTGLDLEGVANALGGTTGKGAIAALQTASGVTSGVTDTFNRADSTTSLGTADTGQVWTALSGTWGISANRGYETTAGLDRYAVLDTALSDGTFSVEVPVIDTNVTFHVGLVFRVADVNNLWLLQLQPTATVLYKRVGGSYTQMGSFAHTRAAGDALSAVCSGSSIVAKVNGATAVSVTDTHNQTATRAGMRMDGSSIFRVDNFTASAVTSGVTDTFNRADSTTSLGTADTGQVWTVDPAAVWGITASKGYVASGSGSAWVSATASDVNVSASITHDGDNGLCFRLVDAANLLMARFGANQIELYRKQSGAWTLLASVAYTIATGAVATLRVRAVGSAVEVYANDVLQISVTEAFQATATRHGLYGAGLSARWDDFTVEAV